MHSGFGVVGCYLIRGVGHRLAAGFCFGLGGLVWLVACCDAFCCVGLGLIVVLGGCSGVFRVVGWV